MKDQISKYALDLGFCKIGFSRAEELNKEFPDFEGWLANGYHASMKYMEKNSEKRYDVRNILPDAKTVIILAYNYYTGDSHTVNSGIHDKGKISRYAWGDDYHEIIKPKLQDMATFIRSIDDHYETWVYVDTGPVMEKAWAARAGIGWQGKHSIIISREFGSWLLLGTILTNLAIEPDEPIRNYCGTCTKCIESCPTKAIIAPGIIDANKCIAYWTIEAIPDLQIPNQIAKSMNGWLFGCDICQDACPWNKNLNKNKVEEAFLPRFGETEISLDQILKMSKEDFSSRFKNSPVKRAKIEGLIRNAKALIEFKIPDQEKI